MRKITFMLLFAVSALFAEYKPLYSSSGDSLLLEWSSIAGAIFLIGIFLTGLVYMAGNSLMNDKIKGWAKTEFVELFYSAVLFAIIVSIYLMGNEVAKAFAFQIDSYSANTLCTSDDRPFHMMDVDSIEGYRNLPCHLRIAKNFLASIFYETGGFVKAVGVTHSWYTYFSSLSLDYNAAGTTAYFSGASINHALFGFLNAKNNGLSFLFDNGVKILTIVRFQEVLVNFIGLALFPVLMTVGLILRTFMLTRKLGGLLIAMAISLYFIYPIFYIVGDSIYNSIIIAQHYDPLASEKPAIAWITADLGALPSKPADLTPTGSAAEDLTFKTSMDDISSEFLNSLGMLSSTEKCEEAAAEVEAAGGEEGNIVENEGFDITSLDSWDDNILLGDWLSGLYSSGGSTNPASFKSILAGIDVLAKALFFSMFFSFLSVFATISAVKTLSPMLGGDVEIAGLTHLI